MSFFSFSFFFAHNHQFVVWTYLAGRVQRITKGRHIIVIHSRAFFFSFIPSRLGVVLFLWRLLGDCSGGAAFFRFLRCCFSSFTFRSLSLSLSLFLFVSRLRAQGGGGAVTPKEWRVVPLALRHDDEDGPKMIFSKRKKMK